MTKKNNKQLIAYIFAGCMVTQGCAGDDEQKKTKNDPSSPTASTNPQDGNNASGGTGGQVLTSNSPASSRQIQGEIEAQGQAPASDQEILKYKQASDQCLAQLNNNSDEEGFADKTGGPGFKQAAAAPKGGPFKTAPAGHAPPPKTFAKHHHPAAFLKGAATGSEQLGSCSKNEKKFLQFGYQKIAAVCNKPTQQRTNALTSAQQDIKGAASLLKISNPCKPAVNLIAQVATIDFGRTDSQHAKTALSNTNSSDNGVIPQGKHPAVGAKTVPKAAPAGSQAVPKNTVAF